MANRYEKMQEELHNHPQKWLVTGAAGFIGSHLVQNLLEFEQNVVGIDNFATGYQHNLEDIQARVSEEQWDRFHFLEADIADIEVCRRACGGVERVLHQAAIGSVPRSMIDPLTTHSANVDGYINMLIAAKDAGCESFVYASSSSVYGDHPDLPKTEDATGSPLSPYAATKRINEIYAEAFTEAYNYPVIGLRYFNVFGARQDPSGPYAAVIPRWIIAFQKGDKPVIFGDGETSRDFCPVENVIQSNVLAAMADQGAFGRVYNIALNARTTLTELYYLMRDGLVRRGVPCADIEPDYQDFRPGDIRHSQADIHLARELLGYDPELDVKAGLEGALDWFIQG